MNIDTSPPSIPLHTTATPVSPSTREESPFTMDDPQMFGLSATSGASQAPTTIDFRAVFSKFLDHDISNLGRLAANLLGFMFATLSSKEVAK